MIAIYLAEYASPRFRSWAKPTIEVLAGIPTIVYGVFALMIIIHSLKAWVLWLDSKLMPPVR